MEPLTPPNPQAETMTNSIPVISQLWRRIEAMPKPIPEDSFWLRVLVQLLVIAGIIATDVAIEETPEFMGYSG